MDVGSAHFAVYVERTPLDEYNSWRTSVRETSQPLIPPLPLPPGQAQWKACWNLRSKKLGERTDGPVTLTTPIPLQPSLPHSSETMDAVLSKAQVPWEHKHLLWNLQRHRYIWESCQQVLIEKQLNRNPKAIRLEQTALIFFALCMPGIRVDSYPAKFKTSVLGYPFVGKKYKHHRKVWAVEQASEIVRRRNDGPFLSWFGLPRIKKDDIADAILMVQAWKIQQRLLHLGKSSWVSFPLDHSDEEEAKEEAEEEDDEEEKEEREEKE